MAKESSFFEKLKKGMGIEEPIEEKTEEIKEKPPRKTKVKKPKKLDATHPPPFKAIPIEPEVEKIEEPEIKREEIKEEKPEVPSRRVEGGLESFAPAPTKVSVGKRATEGKEKWFEPEGQLAIDVYQTKNELVIQSAIAGVKPENLDISIEGDVITIRGGREKPLEEEGNYFAQECYWGLFSREIILPVEVDPGRVEATMKEGILTIRIPKILREGKKKISVKS